MNNPTVYVRDAGGKLYNRTLRPGESGGDEVSSEGCPCCYTEPCDFGVSCWYKWDASRNGWNWGSACATCGHSDGGFWPAAK